MKRFLCVILSVMFILSLSSPFLLRAEEDDETMVREAFKALCLYVPGNQLITNDEMMEKTKRSPIFQPYFFVNDLELETDTDNPNIIHYSCTIPGAAGVALTMLNGSYYSLMDIYCPRVNMSGSLTLVTANDGTRRISADNVDNPFYLYINLRCFNEDDVSYPVEFKAAKEYTDEEYNDALNVLLFYVGGYYGETLGDANYIDSVVAKDIKSIGDNIEYISVSATNFDKKETKAKSPFDGIGASIGEFLKKAFFVILIILAIIVILFAGLCIVLGINNYFTTGVFSISDFNPLRKYKNMIRRAKKRGNNFPYSKHARLRANTIAQSLISYKETDSFWGEYSRQFNRELEACILLNFCPTDNKNLLLAICKLFVRSTNSEQFDNLDKGKNVETIGGWALAAIGRYCTLSLMPDDIEKGKVLLEKVVEEYQNDLKTYCTARDQNAKLEGDIKKAIKTAPKSKEFNSQESFAEIEARCGEKLQSGVFGYLILAGINPFQIIVNIACDTNHNYHRFIVQCAIMTVFPFLQKHSKHTTIKPLLDHVMSSRANMIHTDSQMTFFEVRVPSDCSTDEYAIILDEVLRSANPEVKFANTKKMIALAKTEIPDVMKLLCNYPLRLIDTANTSTEGFFKFEPYKEAHYTNYSPPLFSGPVHRRFHEFLDMTVPNSTGLNLRLFTDKYSICPVLFHEYCHYQEDHNEASVFLRTQLFSQKFYQKYNGRANPKKDYAFIHLQNMLGMPPDSKHVELLNKLIIQYYGPQQTKEVAKKHAIETINQTNIFWANENTRQTWCPEVPYPLLSENDDKENFILLRTILERYGQLPRTISKITFQSLLENWSPVVVEKK